MTLKKYSCDNENIFTHALLLFGYISMSTILIPATSFDIFPYIGNIVIYLSVIVSFCIQFHAWILISGKKDQIVNIYEKISQYVKIPNSQQTQQSSQRVPQILENLHKLQYNRASDRNNVTVSVSESEQINRLLKKYEIDYEEVYKCSRNVIAVNIFVSISIAWFVLACMVYGGYFLGPKQTVICLEILLSVAYAEHIIKYLFEDHMSKYVDERIREGVKLYTDIIYKEQQSNMGSHAYTSSIIDHRPTP